MHPSNPTWTWTCIKMLDRDRIHHLCRSPEGRLIFSPWYVGKPFTIVVDNDDRGMPAQPHRDDLRMCHTFFQVQLSPGVFMATRIRPDGTPAPPERPFDNRWHAVQKPDGSWHFLSTSESAVPETSYQNNRGAQHPAFEVNAEGREPKESEVTINEKPGAQNYGNSGDSGNAAYTEASRSGNPKLPNYSLTQSPNYQITQLPNPAAMMGDLEALIHQHLVCTEAQGSVLALWILHTYTYRTAHLTPYLNVSSRIEESGKSTCMTILRSLCAQPWWAAGVSRSAFTRKITADQPTVLLDNWQTVFSSSDKTQITGFLLTGCDSSYGNEACTETCRSGNLNYPITNLPNYPIQNAANPIDSFCPKAFAGPDPLPSSLARRSIPIVLQRPKPDEVVKRAMNLLAPGATAKLTSWMQQWARAHVKRIETTLENCVLPGLSPHQQESARVLIALADTIGGDWSQKARAALPEVFKDAQLSEIAPLRLLSDIRHAFAHHGNPERIFTAELLDYLHDLDHRTWHEWSKKGDPMTPHALSVILHKSFNIYSRSQRRGEDKRRGYQLLDFIESWERYLPTLTPQSTPKSPEEAQENPVAQTIEIVSANKSHARRRAEVACTEVSQRRAEVACTEVSQRRAEVRQRSKTAVKPHFMSISKLKAGCRRLANRFAVNWF